MNKLRALLLPLAVVFAAIALFEFGSRYGAANVRAVALSSQLQTYTNYYMQVRGQGDTASEKTLEKIVDNHIATAALQRDAWFLRFKEEPRASLEKALASGLSVRGEAALEHMSSQAEEEQGKVNVPAGKLEEIKAAVSKAREELVQQGASAEGR
jgi:hypothetical protein